MHSDGLLAIPLVALGLILLSHRNPVLDVSVHHGRTNKHC